MKYYYDLHIHSALSPCAENEMSPNNIVNMACVNDLDIIAVTDHNSSENLPALMKCADKKGIILIPGIEVESVEEVHVVCLFANLDSAMKMGRLVMKHLPQIENNSRIFGEQLIMDEEDRITSSEGQLLLVSTDLSVGEIFQHVDDLNGCAYFAHVDRGSYSVLSVLGDFPNDVGSGVIEVTASDMGRSFLANRADLEGRIALFSSDAHRLRDISGRDNSLELPYERGTITAENIVGWIKRKNMG